MFFVVILASLFKLDDILLVDVSDSLVDVIVFKENVQENLHE